MALEDVKARYIPKDNQFYRKHYEQILIALMGVMVIMIGVISYLIHQVNHLPLPVFYGIEPQKKQLLLIPTEQPNLLSSTILQFASKAASASYSFAYSNWRAEINRVRPYYTDAGFRDYLASVESLINTILQNQLLVYGVVSAPPVIANQGQVPGRGYVWRVQIPFLVTYESANNTTSRHFLVVISIVKVPTNINPQGIGIDQFVMLPR
jgi:intracellular multiplication protein IcmL